MFVSICGNIGSGKTTVLEKLESNGFDVKFEPIHEWTFLSNFYKNMKEYAFKLQMQILKSFLSYKEHHVLKSLPTICERSPQESFHVFSSQLLKNKYLTLDEYRIIRFFTYSYAWKPEIYIYIRTEPSVCLERISNRNRDCENEISLTYISELHKKYEQFSRTHNITHIVDGSQSPQDVYTHVRQIIENLNK